MRAALSSPGESGELPTGQSFGALMRLNALDSVWDDFTRHCTPARMSDYLERMRAITKEVRQPVPVKNIVCCVDLIWGDRDRMTPIDAASYFIQGLRDNRLTVFASCRHNARLERVVETAALIRSLLSPLR
ncbi:alpha/beta fold hydrolase [Hydrocarboniphaga effusa]|uniref:alpha/beta fold hydrolase n=1 Tax=Hydrocarboniphaga effusa TaxID=243629 RepID=UPI00398BD765